MIIIHHSQFIQLRLAVGGDIGLPHKGFALFVASSFQPYLSIRFIEKRNSFSFGLLRRYAPRNDGGVGSIDL
jgi:hypothetical protein